MSAPSETSLGFEATLSALLGLVGRDITVMVGFRSPPTVGLAGVLRAGTDEWEPMCGRSSDEVVTFAVGEPGRGFGFFAIDRAVFVEASQTGEEIAIVLDGAAISVTLKGQAG